MQSRFRNFRATDRRATEEDDSDSRLVHAGATGGLCFDRPLVSRQEGQKDVCKVVSGTIKPFLSKIATHYHLNKSTSISQECQTHFVIAYIQQLELPFFSLSRNSTKLIYKKPAQIFIIHDYAVKDFHNPLCNIIRSLGLKHMFLFRYLI